MKRTRRYKYTCADCGKKLKNSPLGWSVDGKVEKWVCRACWNKLFNKIDKQ